MDWKEELLKEATEMIAERFGISPNNDGEHDTSSYDWEAGCYCNGVWLCPKAFLGIMEDFIENNSYIFEEYFNE